MSGAIKIGDFGLVTDVEMNAHAGVMEGGGDIHPNLKHTMHVGTDRYMSPEQVRTETTFN